MSEQISALMDDEIAVEDATHLIVAMQSSRQAAEAWSQYHLIGDAIRGDIVFSKDFKQSLMHKLDLEPTVLAPKTAQITSHDAIQFKDKLPVKWTMAASFAAVMVVGWMALQQQVQPGAAPGATSGATMEMANAEVTEQTIPTEYLTAHQSSAPSTSSYYIQSVNYAE